MMVHVDPIEFERQVEQGEKPAILLPTLQQLEVTGSAADLFFRLFEVPALSHLVLLRPPVNVLSAFLKTATIVSQVHDLRNLTLVETHDIQEPMALAIARTFPTLTDLS